MLQRAVGRGLQPQTHQLIDVFPLPAAQHLTVAGGAGAAGQLLLRQESEGPCGVRRQQLLLGGKQHLQHRQEKHGAGAPWRGHVLFGIQQAAGEIVGIRQPALLRLPAAQSVQLRTAQGQHVGAAQALAAEQRSEALHIALRLQASGQRLAVGQPVRRGAAGQAAAQGGVHLADAFFRHGDPSRIRGRGSRKPAVRRQLFTEYCMPKAQALSIFSAANLHRP